MAAGTAVSRGVTAVDWWRYRILLVSERGLLGNGIFMFEGVVGELCRMVRWSMTITWSSIKSHCAVSLVSDALLVLQAVGQVRAIGEHPRLPRGGLAGGWRPEGSVPACPRGAGELSGEVDGEGAQALVLVQVRVPGGLLLDEGVGGEGGVRGPWGEVQYRGPLGAAVNRHVAAAVPGQGGDWG